MKKLFSLIIILIWGMLVTGCDNQQYRQFEDLERESLIFPNDPNKGIVIYAVNWLTKDELAIQGFWRDNHWPIYIGNLTKREILPLEYDGKVITGVSPSISPDGRYIALNNYLFGSIQILDNSSTHATKEIITNSTTNLTWSSDSTKLAYTSVERLGSIKIVLYDTDSQKSQTVFEYLGQNVIPGEGISWSTAGDPLTFTVVNEVYTEKDRKEQSDVYVFNMRENSLFRITNTPEISERYPFWYSNEVITFTSTVITMSEELDGVLSFYNIYQDCSKEIKGIRGIKSPSWSPDRQRIAFVADHGVYIVKAESIINRIGNLSSWICEK